MTKLFAQLLKYSDCPDSSAFLSATVHFDIVLVQLWEKYCGFEQTTAYLCNDNLNSVAIRKKFKKAFNRVKKNGITSMVPKLKNLIRA